MKSGYSLLLDTHIVIWIATAPERLPASLKKAIETAKTRYVSHASAWEIQIKYDKHGPRFAFSLDQFELTMKAFSCTELPIDYQDIRGLDQVNFVNSDPFDRLLMSQAARRSVYLATLDQNIIQTFERNNAFSIFTDRACER